VVTAKADIFCRLVFFPSPFSGIQEPAYHSHGHQYQDYRMELENKKQQESSSHQEKDDG